VVITIAFSSHFPVGCEPQESKQLDVTQTHQQPVSLRQSRKRPGVAGLLVKHSLCDLTPHQDRLAQVVLKSILYAGTNAGRADA
jgi:hypothetical protein